MTHRNKKFSLNASLQALISDAKQKGVVIDVMSDSKGYLIVNVATDRPIFGTAGLDDQEAVIDFLNENLPTYRDTAHVLVVDEFDLFA